MSAITYSTYLKWLRQVQHIEGLLSVMIAGSSSDTEYSSTASQPGVVVILPTTPEAKPCAVLTDPPTLLPPSDSAA
jgi:hypothetical protein